MKKAVFMLGRIGLSLIFIYFATIQILNWDQVQQTFDTSISNWIVHPGLPDQIQKVFNLLLSYSSLIMIFSVVFTGIGSLFVLLGIQVRLGVILLILFLLPCTVIMHPFWMYEGANKEMQMLLFLKNISIIGGLLVLASSESGGQA